MIRVDAWQPPGGSFQDISVTSNYRGLFLSTSTLSQSASAQIEQAPATAGYLRGILATTQELPITLFKKPGFSSQTFHTNIRSWFDPYASARATGYLRVIWEDGSTQLRIPARVVGLSTIPDTPDAYTVILKAEQPHFEATSESSTTGNAATVGNVRAGAEVELTGATLANCAFGTASDKYTGRLLKVQANTVTTDTNARTLINGVPVPWRTAEGNHFWAIVTGDNPTVEYLRGLTGNDPLLNTITANQINLTGAGVPYNYSDMRISTLLADDRLGGLWRPMVYLPSAWPAPSTGWGYFAENTTDGFRLHLNDTPTFGAAGNWPYNGIYLDSGGPRITAVTQWDIVVAGITGTEARAVLLGRDRGSDVWQEIFGTSTNAGTTVNVTGAPLSTGNITELLWTIVPATDTLTTDPSLEINPDAANTLTMGAEPSLTASSTRYRRLHGTFSNGATGQNYVFSNFTTRGRVDLHTPSRRVDWDIELETAGLVYGYFTMGDPERGMEFAPSVTNIISNTTGGTYTAKWRDAYA